MPSDPLHPALDAFAQLGQQRAWSLIVTLFGDLAPRAGDAFEGQIITHLMGRMGIRSEATRVALHRLRAEGWIVSEKFGRRSRHSLSANARAETDAASKLIYGCLGANDADWRVYMTDDKNPQAEGLTQIAGNVFAGPILDPQPDDILVLEPRNKPDWFSKLVEPDNLREDYAGLLAVVRGVAAEIGDTPDLPADTAALLRCQTVHAWRRIVLKHPPLPSALHSSGWPGTDCALETGALLSAIPRPSLADLHGS